MPPAGLDEVAAKSPADCSVPARPIVPKPIAVRRSMSRRETRGKQGVVMSTSLIDVQQFISGEQDVGILLPAIRAVTRQKVQAKSYFLISRRPAVQPAVSPRDSLRIGGGRFV